MVANTDELILEKSLQERLRSSQQTLMEAIRQRDMARLEVQRLMLDRRDHNECRDQTESALVERLRETSPESFHTGDSVYVAIDVSEWPSNWHFARMFDVMMEDSEGYAAQVQFWLVEYTGDTAIYQACRLV